MKLPARYSAKGIHPPILFIRVGRIIILFFRKCFVRVEMQNNIGGLTLVETLIVVALSLLLVAAATPLYGGFFTTSQSSERFDELAGTLRLAREESVTRVSNLAHGVHFVINPSGPDEYILYEGASYVPSSNERRIRLEDSFTMTTTLSGNDINFSLGLGVPNTMGTITITQSAGNSRTLTVNQYGVVSEE